MYKAKIRNNNTHIKVYPFFNEDIYYSHKYRCCYDVFAVGKIRETLVKMGISENHGIFIKNTDYSKFIKMRRKNDTGKIFEVTASMPDGTDVPCTCFLSVKEEYIGEYEENRKIVSGIIVDNTDKEQLDWAYKCNSMQDEKEEW
jgi:hypothetical protein